MKRCTVLTVNYWTLAKNSNTFAHRLRQVREDHGMNAKEFAEQVLQMDRGQYRNTEGGKMYLSVERMLMLTEATHINLHWLLTGEGDMYVNYSAGRLPAAAKLFVQGWLKELRNPTPADTREATEMLRIINRLGKK